MIPLRKMLSRQQLNLFKDILQELETQGLPACWGSAATRMDAKKTLSLMPSTRRRRLLSGLPPALLTLVQACSIRPRRLEPMRCAPPPESRHSPSQPRAGLTLRAWSKLMLRQALAKFLSASLLLCLSLTRCCCVSTDAARSERPHGDIEFPSSEHAPFACSLMLRHAIFGKTATALAPLAQN